MERIIFFQIDRKLIDREGPIQLASDSKHPVFILSSFGAGIDTTSIFLMRGWKEVATGIESLTAALSFPPDPSLSPSS